MLNSRSSRILLPKDNQTLTLVLAGIRAPRTSRTPGDKGEPFGTEASEFASRRYMQRDVEFEVETVDKSGGFIGTLYLNKTENAAIELAKEGLASVHEFSAEGLSWARSLTEAEVSCPRRLSIDSSLTLVNRTPRRKPSTECVNFLLVILSNARADAFF